MEWNGVPIELHVLRKAFFKQKLNDFLLQILKNEEMDIYMNHI